MSDKSKSPSGIKPRARKSPARTPEGERTSAERERRLAAALRENLLKRRAQRSARAEEAPPAEPKPKGPGQD